jgi:CBS domain-containing protein
MTIERVCTRSIDTARPDENVWTAAERMHQRGVGALVIVDDLDQPVGLVTDRDLMERVLVRRLDPDETQVGMVMTPNPRMIYEASSIESALAIMRDGHLRRLLVVDHEGKLTGLLCLDDLLMKAAREFNLIGEIVKSQTPCGLAEEILIGPASLAESP